MTDFILEAGPPKFAHFRADKPLFDAMAWLRCAALAGYRHQVIENEAGELVTIGCLQPCSYHWNDRSRLPDRSLWEALGSTEDERTANSAAVDEVLLNSGFADRYRRSGAGWVLTLGTQPIPRGAALISDADTTIGAGEANHAQ